MDESRSIRDLAREFALEAGFTEASLVALPHPNQLRDADRFEAFTDAGHAGSMEWLTHPTTDGKPLRANPATPFPWAKSALICLANYKSAQPGSIDPALAETGWIARYAITGKWIKKLAGENQRPATPNEIQSESAELVPSDYHRVLLKRLRTVETDLKSQLGDFESRAYVDTGPVVERSLAVAAGLGWTGKNTCLIHPRLGSWSFLCVLLTSLEFSEIAQNTATLLQPDRCGTCRRCIDACPTHALYEPYKMDASRCISYLTIEHKGPIEPANSGEDLKPAIGRQIFGCDICQDVCPWNRKSPIAADPELAPRTALVNPSLAWLASLDESGFERLFNGSPVRRTGFAGFRRNLAIAMGNTQLAIFAQQLSEWSHDQDATLRSAAQWALAKLQSSP